MQKQPFPIFKSVALVWCIMLTFIFTTVAFKPIVKTGVKDVYNTQPVTKIENNPNRSLLLFGASTSLIFSLVFLYSILNDLNKSGGEIQSESELPQKQEILNLLVNLQNQQQVSSQTLPQEAAQSATPEPEKEKVEISTLPSINNQNIQEDNYPENVVSIGSFQGRKKVTEQDFIEDLGLTDLWEN